MSNLSIDTLPLLSNSNFSPYSDYIVVQKPDGQTYKMLLADAYGASNAAGSNYTFTDSQVFLMASKGNHEISFKEPGLLDESTSFMITITTTITQNGTQSAPDSSSQIGSSVVYRFTKPTDSKFINQNISLGSSVVQNVAQFKFPYRWSSGVSGAHVNYPTTTYAVNIDTQDEDNENEIKLSFSSSLSGHMPNFKNKRGKHVASEVKISAILQANIV